jgi:hypothetical protein
MHPVPVGRLAPVQVTRFANSCSRSREMIVRIRRQFRWRRPRSPALMRTHELSCPPWTHADYKPEWALVHGERRRSLPVTKRLRTARAGPARACRGVVTMKLLPRFALAFIGLPIFAAPLPGSATDLAQQAAGVRTTSSSRTVRANSSRSQNVGRTLNALHRAHEHGLRSSEHEMWSIRLEDPLGGDGPPNFQAAARESDRAARSAARQARWLARANLEARAAGVAVPPEASRQEISRLLRRAERNRTSAAELRERARTARQH